MKDDDLNAARGIINGVVIGAALWVVIGLIIWSLV